MFQALIQLLPQERNSLTLVLAGIGLLGGLALWGAGVRFGRGISSLVMCLMGAIIASEVGRYFQWPLASAALLIAGAVLGGAAGFWMHRLCTVLAMGVSLSLWAMLLLARGHETNWPVMQGNEAWLDYLLRSASALPGPVKSNGLLCIALCVAMSGAAHLRWPRHLPLLAWSLIGVSLMTLTAALLVSATPGLLPWVPAALWRQAAVVVILCGAGVLMQMRQAHSKVV